MTPHRAINWLLTAATVAAIVFLLAIDAPSDLDTAQAVAADVQDAIHTAQAQAREARP